MARQVKSKQRVADHGEVFTAEREVQIKWDDKLTSREDQQEEHNVDGPAANAQEAGQNAQHDATQKNGDRVL